MAPLTRRAHNNEYRGTGLFVIEVVLTPLALILTLIRVGVRKYNRHLGWDDATIVAAMLSRLLSFCFTMISLSDGNGQHKEFLSDEAEKNVMKWTWANEVLIFVTICLIKVSICLFIFRIKKTGWLKWCLYIVMAGLVFTNLSCVIILLAQCQPLHAYWDKSAGSCWDTHIYNGFIYVSVSYSVVSDVACTLLPVVILWNVNISPRVKLSVSGLMSLGLIASGCAAVRAALSTQNESSDPTWALALVSDWAFCEANVGIIAANLALSRMLYVLFRKEASKSAITEPTHGYPLQYHGAHSPHCATTRKKRSRMFHPLNSEATETIAKPYVLPENSKIVKTTDIDLREELHKPEQGEVMDWYETSRPLGRF